MPRRPVPTGGLRRRLTVAFVLVAAVSSGLLAAGSFFLVREARYRDSLERAAREARSVLRQAGTFPEPFDVDGFLAGVESAGLHAVLVDGTEATPSDRAVDPPVPGPLAARVRRGELGFQRVGYRGTQLLLVGGRIPGSNRELYLVFAEERIRRELVQLGVVLAAGWGAVAVASGLIGRALARRTLEPVARASQAARAMAEGLLATRLPVETGDEFGAWAASFNEMAEALEAKVRALSEAQARERRFTADVAHELRTPVTALVGEASLLREHLDRVPEPARRPAELLVRDVGRLRRLVDELMEISRLDAGRESVRPEEVSLAALVEATIRSRGWGGRVAVEGEDVVLSTDRRRVERVVANLVGNALEHGGRDVRVTLGRDGEAAVVQVADRGPGIDPRDLPHVFERFYKADSSRAGPGSGLGLAIALENARLLGGDIEVWSERGVGTRFTVRLPVSQRLPGGDGPVTAPGQDGAQARQKGERP